MAVHFHDVFFCIGMGCFHNRNQHFVNDFPVGTVGDFPIGKGVAGFFRQFLFALENGVRQSDTAFPAHADDADAAAAQWCGDGSNDVVQKICLLQHR